MPTEALWEASPEEKADEARKRLEALTDERAQTRREMLAAQDRLADLDADIEDARRAYRAAVEAIPAGGA